MDLACDTVLSEIPNFMDFGLSSIHTTAELRSIFFSITTIGSLTHGSNWIPSGHHISVATSYRLSRTRPKHNFNFKSDFETRREEVVDQYFGLQNDSMSHSPLDSTPFDTNMPNRTISPSD